MAICETKNSLPDAFQTLWKCLKIHLLTRSEVQEKDGSIPNRLPLYVRYCVNAYRVWNVLENCLIRIGPVYKSCCSMLPVEYLKSYTSWICATWKTNWYSRFWMIVKSFQLLYMPQMFAAHSFCDLLQQGKSPTIGTLGKKNYTGTYLKHQCYLLDFISTVHLLRTVRKWFRHFPGKQKMAHLYEKNGVKKEMWLQ